MAKVSQRQIVADISPVQGGNAPRREKTRTVVLTLLR